MTIRSPERRLGAVSNGMYGWADIKPAPVDALVDDSVSALAGRASVGSSLDALRSLLPDAFSAFVAKPRLAAVYLSRKEAPGRAALTLCVRIQPLLLEAGLPATILGSPVSVIAVHTMPPLAEALC